MSVSGVRHAATTVRQYTQPRPGTSGELAAPSVLRATIAGGLEGLAGNGQPGVLGGAAGGFVGTQVGARTHHFTLALASGALTSTAVTVGLAVACGAAMTPLVIPLALVAAGDGVAATLSGSVHAGTRDGVVGGFLIGELAGAGKIGTLVAAVASGVGGTAHGTAGKMINGGVVGLLLGAASGALAGPVGIALGATMGAIGGAIGPVVGHKMQQTIRNLMATLQKPLTGAINKLPRKARKPVLYALAAITGAASMAPAAIVSGTLVPVALGSGLALFMLHRVDVKSRKEDPSHGHRPDRPEQPVETSQADVPPQGVGAAADVGHAGQLRPAGR